MPASRYKAYGLEIESEFPIPGFPVGGSQQAQVQIRLAKPDPSALLEIEGIARFQVSGGDQINVEPASRARLEDVASCLRGSAMAALLAQRGCVPLHACAVQSPLGAILFVGAAASGKSTLAEAMSRRGHALLSDDFTAVKIREGAVWVVPSVPRLELWADKLAQTGLSGAEPISKEAHKYIVPAAWSDEEQPVRAIFYLPDAEAAAVEVEVLSQETMLSYLVGNVFRWRLLAAMGLPVAQLQETLTLLVRTSSAFVLRRPRDLNRLSQSCDKISAEMGRLSPKKQVLHWTQERALPTIAFGEEVAAQLEEGRPGFLLLTSYPKSGNTWVRALLTAWRLEGKPPLASLDGSPSYRRRHDFEEVLGIDSAFPSPQELVHWRARLLIDRASLLKGTAPMKLHDRCIRGEDGALVFPAEGVAGVIYIVRNPLDVAASLANHLQVPVAAAVEVMNNSENQFCTDPLEVPGLAATTRFVQDTGSWSDHVTSWLDETRHRCLLIRYEDMLADTVGALQKILEFIEVPWDEAKARKVARDCEFKALQRVEKSQGFSERPANCPSFFRQGSAGDWRTALAPELARKICQKHGEVMRRVGYEREVDEVMALLPPPPKRAR